MSAMEKINFVNSINCLNASTAPLGVALYQPQLNLEAEANRGPHYRDTDVAGAVENIASFMMLAADQKADLIVFPEYCLPVSAIEKICRREIAVDPGVLVIAPIETLTTNKFKELVATLKSLNDVICAAGELQNIVLTDCCVNACAIVAFINGKIHVYFQLKRHSSKWERANLCTSDNYIIFEGEGIALTVLICSDANNPGKYEDQLVNLHNSKPGRIIIHTQWNPSANQSSVYGSFWVKSLSWGVTEYGASVLITNNVAAGSTISQVDTGEGTTVSVPYTKIAFSGDGKPDESYMNDNIFDAFKTLLEEKHVQQYYFAYSKHSSHLIKIKRPNEGVHASDRAAILLFSHKTYLMDFTFLKKQKQLEDIKKEFHERWGLEDDKIDQVQAFLGDYYAERLEILLSSCLLESKYDWLSDDIFLRPIIWSLFYTYIPAKNITMQSLGWFSECFANLIKCKEMGFSISTNKYYPINLRKFGDDSLGWLFHCKGLPLVALTEIIASALNTVRVRNGTKLYMLAVKGDATLEKGLRRRFIEVDKDEATTLGKPTVTNPAPMIDLVGVEIL